MQKNKLCTLVCNCNIHYLHSIERKITRNLKFSQQHLLSNVIQADEL